jgi:predicted RNase H-like HicB family nuclease
MIYVAFIHRDEAPGYGISFPDFPGCVSHGDSIENAIRLGREALGFHAEGLLADGMALPAPRSVDAIMADGDLAEWREGAQIAHVPLMLDLGSPRRVNVSLDYGLLQAIDAAARARGMTRSAFLSSAARKELAGG